MDVNFFVATVRLQPREGNALLGHCAQGGLGGAALLSLSIAADPWVELRLQLSE